MVARIRINRFLAASGLGSRRKVEDLIKRGSVFVNGLEIRDLSARVDPERDIVTLDGEEIINAPGSLVLVMNKPVGVLSTVTDSHNRKTVLQLAREKGYNERLYPVGRLDLNSSGIIFLTDYGDLAFRLTHPRYKIEKTYIVTVKGNVSKKTVREMASGVQIDDFTTKPCEVRILEGDGEKTTVEIVLREGRKRQIRRMFSAFGHKVISLHRSAIGDLVFNDLDPGGIRRLTEGEEKHLKELVGL
ncbi:MAG: rRNA pseudouridine synthase [Candidatus Krumholzibacteriota bacterium]|nr:rRNA pseudouridine synthase [Candidatus Krumholzibacteriota bacterium]